VGQVHVELVCVEGRHIWGGKNPNESKISSGFWKKKKDEADLNIITLGNTVEVNLQKVNIHETPLQKQGN